MKNIIYIFISCLLGTILLAESSAASICDSKETVVYFGNGIKTTEDEAYDSLNILKKQLHMALPTEKYELLEFKVSYNGTHGLPLDLLESTLQVLSGNTSRFWRLFWGLEIIPDWFADKFILLSSVLDKSALVTTDSLKNHVTTYKTKIAEGKKVLLVAHSQGNLFGNQAYWLLNSREQQSFGMVSVANVDNNVLGADSPYTTLETDKVIMALLAAQIALPSRPMEPNTENLDKESADSLGHSFIESYMIKSSNSETKITQQVITVLESLATPSQFVESGVITISLTWGSEPDVDLHVYEPNGMQVFWNNLQGYSGALDRDDRSGYGPEHYTVPACETLERGIYHVGLDYFKGDEPELATIHIEAGLLVRTYEIAIPSEIYGSSNSPELIANILVKGGENGGYDFEIYE
ncbi:MAG: hypothetical protein AMJ61_07015 [Desulfobacterales bacterium SG8_35_2]|nr:MAG: hypothetical protein AMJ61_07015 [Desulfobacterales bacterium SG8_35_2]